MMQPKLSVLALVFVLGAAATAHAQAPKIAIVDMQRAIEDSNAGKAALAKLKAEVEKKQKELAGKRDEIKKLDDELAKQAAVLKPDALEKKKQELQKKLIAWQDEAQRFQNEIAVKEQQATQPIIEKLSRAVTAIATRDKFTFVLRREVVLWPQQTELDITNEVIRKANEMK